MYVHNLCWRIIPVFYNFEVIQGRGNDWECQDLSDWWLTRVKYLTSCWMNCNILYPYLSDNKACRLWGHFLLRLTFFREDELKWCHTYKHTNIVIVNIFANPCLSEIRALSQCCYGFFQLWTVLSVLLYHNCSRQSNCQDYTRSLGSDLTFFTCHTCALTLLHVQ